MEILDLGIVWECCCHFLCVGLPFLIPDPRNRLTIMNSFFLCPETGGKTLEDVDYLFGHGALAWKNISADDPEGWKEKETVTMVM